MPMLCQAEPPMKYQDSSFKFSYVVINKLCHIVV